MRKVIVLGNSCSGKTTFATRLSKKLAFKHVELDALFWEPGWSEATLENFRNRVTAEIKASTWVVDGDYRSKIQDLVWPKADTIIWVDPSLPTILLRFFLRSLGRAFRRELLWGGCRETLRNSLLRKNSLLAWILKTHSDKSKTNFIIFNCPPVGTKVYRLRTDHEIEILLNSLTSCEGLR